MASRRPRTVVEVYRTHPERAPAHPQEEDEAEQHREHATPAPDQYAANVDQRRRLRGRRRSGGHRIGRWT
ncbi:hypothetical protein Psuf_038280 [Phytohabitans suffuscus]|uniref:Uncharacterized protein n=1 Tax=Phytohabitans suffuscus TaxID=624315 RepID=A0A6F8YK65_9ACTN|nr:hypothetical protein Psuf_038280 [Phytohabitans suffuscus]